MKKYYSLFVLIFIILVALALMARKKRSKTMKRKKGGKKEGFNENDKNILGTKLMPCSSSPEKPTGFFRNGYCSTDSKDHGTHVVCAIVDDSFLEFTKSKGNDLTTPRLPKFKGLVSGDKWCLCALRWLEAYNAGKAPKIVPESTNEIVTKYVPKDTLLSFNTSR
jgi:uncharacterized protein (DUF2237 family)